MLIGFKKKINVFFPIKNTMEWVGGINYYKNLFYALSLANKGDVKIFLSEDNPDILFKYASKITNFRLSLWNKFKSFTEDERETIINNNIDIFSHCSQILENFRTIYWIADFQHIHLPEMFSEKEVRNRNTHFRAIANCATLIILSSNDAYNDFKTMFPEYAYKVRILNFVSYIAPSVYSNILTYKIKRKLNLQDKYFYVPNQFWKHKNHIVVLKALTELKRKGIEINVVFSGSMTDYRNRDFIQELLDFVKENNLENNIQFLGVIELREVYYLMRHCVSVINPSLFEGWSSTVEEVKSLGKNIILSNLNVHKEQNPQEGIYFNPYDEKELAEIMYNKWIQSSGGPDYALEKAARKNMLPRMREFGKNYIKILYECLELENNKMQETVK